jgi:hypothetical protein
MKPMYEYGEYGDQPKTFEERRDEIISDARMIIAAKKQGKICKMPTYEHIHMLLSKLDSMEEIVRFYEMVESEREIYREKNRPF